MRPTTRKQQTAAVIARELRAESRVGRAPYTPANPGASPTTRNRAASPRGGQLHEALLLDGFVEVDSEQ